MLCDTRGWDGKRRWGRERRDRTRGLGRLTEAKKKPKPNIGTKEMETKKENSTNKDPTPSAWLRPLASTVP